MPKNTLVVYQEPVRGVAKRSTVSIGNDLQAMQIIFKGRINIDEFQHCKFSREEQAIVERVGVKGTSAAESLRGIGLILTKLGQILK